MPNIPRLDHLCYDMKNEHEEEEVHRERKKVSACSGLDQLCYDNENKNGGGGEHPERKKQNATCAHHVKCCVVFGASIVVSLT